MNKIQYNLIHKFSLSFLAIAITMILSTVSLEASKPEPKASKRSRSRSPEQQSKKAKVVDKNSLSSSLSSSDAGFEAAEVEEKKEAQEKKIMLGDRLLLVQAAVDKAFEECKQCQQNGAYAWTHNGESKYHLLGIDDDLLVQKLALENPDKKNVYIIDVGCGRGDWGFNAMSVLLKDKACQESGKHFHIFSVTGGNECKEEVIQKGNVTHHLFSQFKIENIDEIFLARGFDLRGKVDLIVSNWTLLHLVDPLGTLKRMYSLLTPLYGKLLSSGFRFVLDNLEKPYCFPYSFVSSSYEECSSKNFTIFDQSNAIPLFSKDKDYDVNRCDHYGQLLLMRSNGQELVIPLQYNEERPLAKISKHTVGLTAVFKKGSCSKAEPFDLNRAIENKEWGILEDEDGSLLRPGFDSYTIRYYCNENNQQSKDLYARLKKQGLLVKSSYTRFKY